MTPTIRPVGCRSFARFAAFSARKAFDSRAIASFSSPSLSELSASSFLSVAEFNSWDAEHRLNGGKPTLLVYNLICWRLPFLFIKNFDNDNIALNCSVHILSTKKQDRLSECRNRYTSLSFQSITVANKRGIRRPYLKIIVLISIKMTLVQLPSFYTRD